MLLNTIRKSYRDLIRHADVEQAIVNIPNDQSAANASVFSPSEIQARRLRRQRRLGRETMSRNVGWSVRTW